MEHTSPPQKPINDWRSILQQRETETHFVIEGRHAVERALTSSYEVQKVIKIGSDLSREEASELLGFHFHRSHLAVAKKPSSNPSLASFTPGTLVVLPEIADPGNLGTIIRNTAALGGSGLLLGKGTSPFNAKAVRASAGAIFQLPIRQSPDLLVDLRTLRKTHILLGTCLSPKAIQVEDLTELQKPIALILGPEDFGMKSELKNLCHHLVTIPMNRNMDSLNVASSSAIFLHRLR